MKNIKRIISSVLCLLLCSAILLLGAGCGDPKRASEQGFTSLEEYDVLETTCVAENDRYSLIWDASPSRRCVVLYDKVKDVEWSYIPQESLNASYNNADDGSEVTVHSSVNSPIIVKYFDTTKYRTDQTYASTMSIRKKSFTLRAIENGVEMVCYFPDRSLTVPVAFTLNEKGVDVTIDTARVQESEEYNVYSIVLAPFFCSVSNRDVDKDDHYLFVPSGSGAIINPIMDPNRGAPLKIDEYVYGKDANIATLENLSNTETARFPVYGAVNGDEAICAIIKQGAESSRITGDLAWNLTGYSNVSTEFNIRGYQGVVQALLASKPEMRNLYSDAYTPENLTVGFYPLYDEDASYVGMANTYRDYLKSTDSINTEASKDSLLNIKLVGGVETKEFHFGIPSTAMMSVTTLEQAKEIIQDVKTSTGLSNINYNLVGFGKNGNDVGVVAGGYDINSAFGDEDDLKEIIDMCNTNGDNLFYNFDMVRFRSSGGGVTTAFGKADAANGSFTEQTYFSANLRIRDYKIKPYYLVSRTQFAEVSANIKETAGDWTLSGVSLDTLTSISYSDYSDEQYYSRANFDNQASHIIKTFKNSGLKVAGSDANAFAAAVCTHVYDVPTQSSRYRYYSYEVPFYQIVFKGAVSMSGSSLNLATDSRDEFLKAVESGIGLTYTLIGEYDTNLITAAQNVFYGSVYWDDTIEKGIKTDIVAMTKEYNEFFNNVNGTAIVDHKIINEDVRLTTFANGWSVYVNYGDAEYTEGDVKVAAGSYTAKKGA